MHVMKKGILYAVLASVLWAIVNPFIKQGLSYDFSPMNMTTKPSDSNKSKTTEEQHDADD